MIRPFFTKDRIRDFETFDKYAMKAIDKIGKGIKINCLAVDRTIEGIERSEFGRPFLLAVQWHPERMADQNSPLSKNIKNTFLDIARKLKK